MLSGKGVWAAVDGEVDLAIRMARAIDATHVLFRTGRGTDYYQAPARMARQKIVAAGLVPFAWPFLFCDDPVGEANVALRTWQEGYQGIVFDVEDQAAGKGANAAELGRRLTEEAGLDPQRLYLTSFPNLSAHAAVPYKEMAAFCRGGFMPQCYGTFRWPASYTLGTLTYREWQNWPPDWGERPLIYPILGLYYDLQGKIRMSPAELRIWADELARYRPTFYSVYRAGVTDSSLWPILKELRPWRPATEADWQQAGQQAWAEARVPTSADAALARKAREALGPNAVALGGEQRTTVDGRAWAWQLWSDGQRTVILLTPEGDWDLEGIRVVPWPQ